jgi:hypothetical protein
MIVAAKSLGSAEVEAFDEADQVRVGDLLSLAVTVAVLLPFSLLYESFSRRTRASRAR